jgi:8-oxo-dGTP pyrophosphatase MutT (NUDIX family)
MKPERLARNIIYQSPWVNLYLDTVRFPNGLLIEEFHLLDFPRAAVTAIVENDLGSILFARICRYTSGATEWELPAGGIETGETETEAASREVLEETGYSSKNHELLYSYYPMNGSANKLFHVVRCKAMDHIQDFDRNEVSETRWFTRDGVKQMIKDKVVTDGFTLTALLLWLQDH